MAVLLSVGACGLSQGQSPSRNLTTSLGASQSDSFAASPDPGAETAVPGASLPFYTGVGQIAVTADDGNLYLLQAGQAPLALTSDGVPFDESNNGLVYSHPVWSPNGWLSYVRITSESRQEPRLEVFAQRPDDERQPVRLLTTSEQTYIYGAWSPAACPEGADCARFAFLMGEGSSLALHLAEVNGSVSVSQDEVIGRAQPFYFSWAPDGESMVWFQNAQQLSIYDVSARAVREDLPDTPGLFQAPAWSPTDQRVLFASRESEENSLVILEGSDRRGVGSSTSGAVFFSWSPDGKQVAYASGAFPLSEISVLGADGMGERVLDQVSNVVSFFWSPDSRQIAVVTVEQGGSEPRDARYSAHRYARRLSQQASPEIVLVWWVVDVGTGRTTRLSSFLPTRQATYLLQFFDQYAQSHRVWSPDSRYIVYADQRSQDEPGQIRLLDTQRPDLAPLTLMEGNFAVFSFQE